MRVGTDTGKGTSGPKGTIYTIAIISGGGFYGTAELRV